MLVGRRRAALRVGAVFLCAAGAAMAQAGDTGELERLLQEAETALARGDAATALDGFERVAARGHDVDGEMGLVRAYMQSGQYRRALAFGAHVAGEHFDAPGAGVLYAWLLRVGGQVEVAHRSLSEARARAPADVLALAAERAFAAPIPVANGVLLDGPHRVAPVALAASGSDGPLKDTRVMSSGVLVAGGRRALVPLAQGATLPPRLWVRNGLGETSAVELLSDAAAPNFGVVLVRLVTPFAAGGADVPEEREPFAGSPAYACDYAEAVPATPAWPQLHLGFLGGAAGAAGLRRLGIAIGPHSHGGAVFDAQGRLAGLVLRGPDDEPLLLPRSLWHRIDGMSPAGASAATAMAPTASMPRSRMSPEEVYETALRVTVQVIASP